MKHHELLILSPLDGIRVNALTLIIKIYFLIWYPYTFSTEVVKRNCGNISSLYYFCVIMSLILISTVFYKALILQGEI